VIARARALDPDAASEDAITTASRLDDERDRRTGDPHADGLAAFIAAARRLAEADVRDREVDGVPPWHRRARAAWVMPVALALAAAALVVLAAGVSRLRSTRVVDVSPHSQAPAVVERDDAAEPAFEVAPPQRRATPSPAPQPAATPAPVEVVPPTTAPEPKPRKPSTDSQLRNLADEAEAALARGELARADELLARLVAIGGRHPLVELAYGDRFTIAHRGGIIAKQTKLWRAYLDKFPRGRFADDARAGLCRHGGATGATACWKAYLADFPKGAYRGLARRTIEESDAP
jgi:hypothetical protein